MGSLSPGQPTHSAFFLLFFSFSAVCLRLGSVRWRPLVGSLWNNQIGAAGAAAIAKALEGNSTLTYLKYVVCLI